MTDPPRPIRGFEIINGMNMVPVELGHASVPNLAGHLHVGAGYAIPR